MPTKIDEHISYLISRLENKLELLNYAVDSSLGLEITAPKQEEVDLTELPEIEPVEDDFLKN